MFKFRFYLLSEKDENFIDVADTKSEADILFTAGDFIKFRTKDKKDTMTFKIIKTSYALLGNSVEKDIFMEYIDKNLTINDIYNILKPEEVKEEIVQPKKKKI